MDDNILLCHQTLEGYYITNYKVKLEQDNKWLPVQALGNNIINKLNNRAADIYYNNDSATFNRVYNLVIAETN